MSCQFFILVLMSVSGVLESGKQKHTKLEITCNALRPSDNFVGILRVKLSYVGSQGHHSKTNWQSQD